MVRGALTGTSTTGQVFELYEHRAEPDAAYATTSMLMVCNGEVFEGHFTGAQRYVTSNGDEPSITVDKAEVIESELPAADNTAAIDHEIEEIRQHVDTLDPAVAEFIELLGVESLSQSQANRAKTILDLWLTAPAEAADHDLPATHADLEDADLAYTDNLEQAATLFIAAIPDESSETQVNAALDTFGEAMAAHVELSSALDMVLRTYSA